MLHNLFRMMTRKSFVQDMMLFIWNTARNRYRKFTEILFCYCRQKTVASIPFAAGNITRGYILYIWKAPCMSSKTRIIIWSMNCLKRSVRPLMSYRRIIVRHLSWAASVSRQTTGSRTVRRSIKTVEYRLPNPSKFSPETPRLSDSMIL